MAVPLFDLEASVREIERCIEMGHKGILFSNAPEKAGLPALRDPHWDPIFRTAEDAGLSVNFHIGFGEAAPAARSGESDRQGDQKLWDAFASGFGVTELIPDVVKLTTMGFLSNAQAIAELIVSGLCARYPTLNFVSVESGFGYIPYLIEALDWQWINYRRDKSVSRPTPPERIFPSPNLHHLLVRNRLAHAHRRPVSGQCHVRN